MGCNIPELYLLTPGASSHSRPHGMCSATGREQARTAGRLLNVAVADGFAVVLSASDLASIETAQVVAGVSDQDYQRTTDCRTYLDPPSCSFDKLFEELSGIAETVVLVCPAPVVTAIIRALMERGNLRKSGRAPRLCPATLVYVGDGRVTKVGGRVAA